MALDTSIAIAHLRGERSVVARASRFDRLVLPIVALGELLAGALPSGPSEAGRLKRFVTRCQLAPPGRRAAGEYARIQLALERTGTPIPPNDIWIAATAMALGLPLAARDSHFDLVPGLVVERW